VIKKNLYYPILTNLEGIIGSVPLLRKGDSGSLGSVAVIFLFTQKQRLEKRLRTLTWDFSLQLSQGTPFMEKACGTET
jgi:hypothetical protein